MRPTYYRLDGHDPVPCTMMEWGRQGEDRGPPDPWRVDETMVGHLRVSTVFLGLDHQWHPDGPPLLFETMIFDGSEDEYQERCSTWDEAVQMHAEAVAAARLRT